jgi:hypothetical protein
MGVLFGSKPFSVTTVQTGVGYGGCRLGLTPPMGLLMFDQRRHALTTPELPNITRLVPLERHLSAIRSQFIRGVLIGILASCGVAITVFKYSNIRQHGPALQETSGQTTLGKSDAQAASRARKPISDIAGTSFLPPILPKPQPSKASNDFPDNPAEPPLARQPPKSPVSFPGRQPKPSTHLPEPGRTTETLGTPKQLWSSLQAGNTKAALALADLYMRGEGVPVNCDQARVLLVVASKGNNAEAIKKLQDLNKTGCPTP